MCEKLKKLGFEILEILEVDYLECCNYKLEFLIIIELINMFILVVVCVGKIRFLDNLWV